MTTSSILKECIIFGFPLENDAIDVLNLCILHTKYYIYIQRLFNKPDLYACPKQFKLSMEIEQNVCLSKNNENKFHKFHFIFDNI